MAGNLNAFQLGPGSIVSIETNQGQVLAIVGNADSPNFAAPAEVTQPGGTSTIDVSKNSNVKITQNSNATIVVAGLLPGRAQWLQFLIVQGNATPHVLHLSYPPVPNQPAKTPGGADLTMTVGLGKIDIVSAYWDGSVLYALVAGKDFI